LAEPTIVQLKTVGWLVQFLFRGILGAKVESGWGAITHNLPKLTRKALVGGTELVPPGKDCHRARSDNMPEHPQTTVKHTTV
jgi:hypothetical protein